MNKQMLILSGTKVSLRPITWNDTDLIVQWRNNPSVRKNFIFQIPFTAAMHQQWMTTRVADGEVIQYIIEDKTAGNPVGSVYFRDIDITNNSAEFGIFIGEDSARGKGFGAEATRLFVEFGLEYLSFHRISLRVLSENVAAYRCYKAAGFEKEGTFRDMVKLNGDYRDVIFMAILEHKQAEGKQP